MTRHALFLTTLLATLAGCTGPDVRPPATPSSIAAPAAGWTPAEGVQQAAVRMDWWRALGDPQLDGLVEQALAGNTDLRQASANLRAFAALQREARAASLPSGGISAGIERNRTPAAALQLDTVGGPSVLPTQTLADVGVGLSWELDLGGRIAATQDAAAADRQDALWRQRGAQAAVAAGVVRAWLDLSATRSQIALLTKRTEALTAMALSLDQAVATGGVRADQRDALRRDRLALDRAMPALRAAERNAARRLATLTGKPAPDGVRAMDGLRPGAMPVPAYVHAPDPADLLRLRPDVAQAEQTLLKATAGIGIAKAELYPRITFGGSAGVTASPSDLTSTGALRFGIGPSISWGIFDMTRIRARIRAAGAQADAAAAAWEGAFLRATEETDASLDLLAAARRSWLLAADAEALAAQEQARSTLRLKAGQDSRFADLQVRDRAAAAQQRAAEARAAALQAWVNVQIAFGAGWSA